MKDSSLTTFMTDEKDEREALNVRVGDAAYFYRRHDADYGAYAYG